MAIIQCPECGSQASDSAEACPQCGFGVAKYVQQERARQQAQQAQQQAQQRAELAAKKNRSRNKFIGIMAGLVFVVFGPCCIWSQCQSTQRQEEERAAAEAKVAAEKAEQQKALERTRANRGELLKQADEAIETGDVPTATHLIGRLQKAFPGNDPEIAKAAKLLEQKRTEIAAANAHKAAENALEKADEIRQDDPIAADDLLTEHITSVTRHKAQIEGADDLLKRLEKLKKRNQREADRAREKKAEQLEAEEDAKRRCPSGNCIEISSSKLCRDYEANEVRADKRYRDRMLLVKGKITQIAKGPLDGLYVHMSTGRSCFLGISAHVPKSQEDFLAKMNKGDTVEVRCKGGRMLLGAPTLNNCHALTFWGR